MPNAAEILERIGSSDPETRREALQAILESPPDCSPSEIERLSLRLREQMLRTDYSEPERQSAAMCLGVLGCTPILLEQLTSEIGTIRGHATAGLGRCRCRMSLEALIGMLADPQNTVRNAAERALIGRLADVKANGIDALLTLLDHPEPLTHSPAARLLGLSEDPRALEPLLNLLKNGEKWLSRVWAAKSLGDLGQAAAIAPLVEALQHDEKNRVRAAAAAALGELRDPAAGESLRAALTDADEGVQSAARDALDLLAKSRDAQAIDPLSPEN